MENGNSMSNGGGKSAGNRTKTPGISTSTRLQRNQAEKERRDKLNGFISELATLVPMVSNASKPLDKVSILRLAAAEMRLHFSCLNPKKYKNKPLMLPPAIMASLDLIERTIGGFVIVTTLTGLIVFCSRSIEDYLGYQNIDVMGNKVVKYIYEDDIKYFEAKVSSVVNSLKKGSKKKTKVIKAHMLQKPLPRSNESCRPRNMIFKLSVHKNDLNGSDSGTETSRKTRTHKDFGYAAVVLMFIEPVRLEPEIDITYIDSNQDVYFTRHGLQGEIIYADQRISSITGYMPHDVQGTSAYKYICSSDVPIALFAQKAMFTSNDGKGDIVYRLRIRDMRFIYLQSSGQIAYKESSSEISHFVCFNRLLSEEEGSQELKKFQQRFAPQIMAAKLLQVKQNNATDKSETVEKSMTVANSSVGLLDSASPVSQMGSFQCSKVSSPDTDTGASDQILSGDSLVSPSISSTATSSVHSSERHSMTSPLNRSNSVTPENGGYASERMDFVVQKQEQRSPLRNGRHSMAASTCESVIYASNGVIEKNSGQGANGLENYLFVVKKSPESALNVSGTYRTQQNAPSVIAEPQIMHSVNAFSPSLQNGIAAAGSSVETLSDHPMDFNFDQSDLQNITAFNYNTATSTPTVYLEESIVSMPSTTNGSHKEYAMYNGQFAEEGHTSASFQSHLQQPPVTHSTIHAVATGQQQQMNCNGEQISQNRSSHSQNLLNFTGMYSNSSVSSLPKKSNKSLSAVSELSSTAGYVPNMTSYHVNGNSGYQPTFVDSYNSGANEIDTFDGLNVPNACVTTSLHEMNGFHASSSSVDVLTSFSALNNSFDLMDTSSHSADFTTKHSPMAEYENGGCDLFSSLVAPMNWTGSHSGTDLGLNEELYEELDLFFQNLPQSQSSGVVASPVMEFPVDVSSYQQQNSISSSRDKRNYHP